MACLEDPGPLLDCKLKCLCSAHGEIVCPCPPVNRGDNTLLLKAGHPSEMFYKTEDPFTLLPHCISLSILNFDFSSSLLLSP